MKKLLASANGSAEDKAGDGEDESGGDKVIADGNRQGKDAAYLMGRRVERQWPEQKRRRIGRGDQKAARCAFPEKAKRRARKKGQAFACPFSGP
ncbi:hypothetical protein [Azospirillum soli]|uniref:hypothetical protein n=1 Tax=Azospirillum soli TaxID=1304799 RepID=UPI001AE1480B|nr:hypothetical protein [Azospirillum soli]MBP2316538.1 hypothetical protein [Azospirillum soli]